MKRLVSVVIAGTIGLGLAFAQGPQPRHQGPEGGKKQVSESERIEKRVDFLKEKLSLSDKQTADLKELLTKQSQERKEAVEAHRKAMQEMSEKNKADFEKLLTSEQLAELEKIKAERPAPGAGPAPELRKGLKEGPDARHHRHLGHRPPHDMPQQCDSCSCCGCRK